ncbi:MAG: hypothetical protein RLZZ618_1262 [Pseudomonadota bacterium]|jgi:thiol-disulfide isomerase/thioredoxin
MPTSDIRTDTLVVCLCAAWCGSCRDYRATFNEVRERFESTHAGLRFLWVDIEDESDLVDPLDVENFPTLLIASGSAPRFFGAVTPQPETLARIVLAHLPSEAGLITLPDPDLHRVVTRLRQHLSPE